jgi:hypothetical protein
MAWGISGGGATSRLLMDYAEPTYSALFDLLFTPQIGAAFQNVKVEIPADADTTCGSEVAHRHDAADSGSCTRGYEGTFLAAASVRRPGIATSALQWAAPAFVGENGTANGTSLYTPTNVDDYVLPWLRCMRDAYNVTLTWQGGGWNERIHNNTYIIMLRQKLTAGGFSGTGVTAADQCCHMGWNIVRDLDADPVLRAAVGAVSTHCAGSLNNQSTPAAVIALGIPLFQGEEHIGLPDPDSIPVWQWPAAAATGVSINQNWVLNNMSSTVYWPAAYAWISRLFLQGKGFVIATSPWGTPGRCYVPTALWIVAHTTHFTTPQVSWLLNRTGSGHLTAAQAPIGQGGWNVSYVTYVTGRDVTLVVESFLAGGQWHAADGSAGAASSAPPVSATFQLAGSIAGWKSLHVWHTNESVTFEQLPDVLVAADGTFSISVEPGAIYTYTSIASSHPGAEAWLARSVAAGGCGPAPRTLPPGVAVPPEDPFPLPHYDDFEGYANDTLPLFTSDMFGAFTVFQLPPGSTATATPAASSAAAPLRARPGIEARRVACGDAGAIALRPHRCITASGPNNTRVLRQWTRQPPLGWGSHQSSNMATVIGNASLSGLTVAVRALIETPDPAFAPQAAPYVLVGMNAGAGGNAPVGGFSPKEFYSSSPAADFVRFTTTTWQCSLAAQPGVCAQPHSLDFGFDSWHDVVFAELPLRNGSAAVWLSLDGQILFNVTVAAVRNGGGGGYVLLETGAHRAQFDDLAISSTAAG